MPKMIYVSKVNTKIREKDGSYRNVARGEEFPEAETFKNPLHWAILVNAESKEGKHAIAMREKSLNGGKDTIPSPEVSGEGTVISSEQKNENSNEEKDNGTEGEKPEEPNGEEVKAEEAGEVEEGEAEEGQESKDPLDGMDADQIKDLVFEKFGVKLHHNAGVEKCRKAYFKLLKDHSTGEA